MRIFIRLSVNTNVRLKQLQDSLATGSPAKLDPFSPYYGLEQQQQYQEQLNKTKQSEKTNKRCF